MHQDGDAGAGRRVARPEGLVARGVQLSSGIVQSLLDCPDVRAGSEVGLLEADHIEALIYPQLAGCVYLGDA